jgi:glyoxylase-like metal-dependent hydrolase (beta-lactamase superfamily II)
MKFAIIPVTGFQQNSTLMWDEATLKGAVVDPGGDLDVILGEADKHGVTLEKILLTHGHIDHAGATAQLARQRSLPIEGPHREEAFWIDQLPAQSQRFGFPPSEAFTPDRWLEHGDTVTVGNETLQVLHTPGHTPGHVAFFHAPSRVAIVGDVLFQGSIGRTDFPRGDFETLVRSIRERLWPLGNDVTFIPGHGPVSTFGRERATNPYVGDGASPKHL